MRRKRPGFRALPSFARTGHSGAGWLPPEPGMLNSVKNLRYRFPPGMPSRRAIWIVVAAAAAAVLVAVALIPAAGPRPAAEQSRAEQALRDIADAQAEAKESQGRYGSYWLSGGDRTLEKLTHPIRTEGVADLRSIECPTGGWQPHGLEMTSRSCPAWRTGWSVQEQGEVVRPECMTSEAVESMLADLGVPRQSSAPAASAFDRPEGASRVPAELSHHAREELDE